MFSIQNRALSWAITSFGNKFCLKMRSRLMKTLNNRFYDKFMQLEIGLFHSPMPYLNLRPDFITFLLHNDLTRLQLFVIILNCVKISDRSQQAQDVNAVLFKVIRFDLLAPVKTTALLLLVE